MLYGWSSAPYFRFLGAAFAALIPSGIERYILVELNEIRSFE